MDSSRFDRVARTLSSVTPRRTTIGLLLGGALGIASLAGSETKKGKGKGKGKNKKKDICKKANAACANGKCTMGQACCSDLHCDDCTNVYCVGGGGGRPGVCGCEGGDILHNGRCGTRPVCLSAGERREFADIRCCSGIEHSEGPPSNPYSVCDPGVLSCLADSDCTGGKCRGFVCAGLEVDCPQ
jgi:hypothetical protein